MHQDPVQVSHHSRSKCANCGLVNAVADEVCRRCGTSLTDDETAPSVASETSPAGQTKRRGFLKRIIWVLGATVVLLIIWYASLLISSDGLQSDERSKVEEAINLVKSKECVTEEYEC